MQIGSLSSHMGWRQCPMRVCTGFRHRQKKVRLCSALNTTRDRGKAFVNRNLLPSSAPMYQLYARGSRKVTSQMFRVIDCQALYLGNTCGHETGRNPPLPNSFGRTFGLLASVLPRSRSVAHSACWPQYFLALARSHIRPAGLSTSSLSLGRTFGLLASVLPRSRSVAGPDSAVFPAGKTCFRLAQAREKNKAVCFFRSCAPGRNRLQLSPHPCSARSQAQLTTSRNAQ